MTESNINLEDLKEHLMKNHVEVTGIKKVRPSLEDVFVFLVEKESKK
ncbi:hypothetical protein SDC9_194913 [bioreactor metagenome]|uniref:Uncharacterized protein n=1 Tax=bioreactor metagenome TaxID=1076179 RepID=A0A645I7L3_9ZZZZ